MSAVIKYYCKINNKCLQVILSFMKYKTMFRKNKTLATTVFITCRNFILSYNTKSNFSLHFI